MIRLPLLPLLPLLFLLSPGFGKASAQETRPNNMVTVSEGDGALLHCNLSSENSDRRAKFDWRKDGKEEKKEVFMYENGSYYGQGLPGQNEQFIGRVEFFKDEVASGNASIKIKNTRLEDSGTYTCSVILFPVTPVVNIILNVGAAPVPYVKPLKVQSNRWLLQCKVQGVPKPQVEWQNSAGKPLLLSDKDHNISEYEDASGRFHVEVYVNVTRSDTYTCVATQRSIYHQINNTLTVPIQDASMGWIVAGIFGTLLGLIIFFLITRSICKSARRKRQGTKE